MSASLALVLQLALLCDALFLVRAGVTTTRALGIGLLLSCVFFTLSRSEFSFEAAQMAPVGTAVLPTAVIAFFYASQSDE